MHDALKAVEVLAKAFEKEPFDVYLLGGSGCILAGYLDRATRDFDIIDLDYSASLGIVMKPLEPFDMIDEKLAALAPDYKNRATKLSQYTYLSVYVLSREDIIVSKMARLNERDINDISKMLTSSDIPLIFNLVKEVLSSDLIPKAKQTLLDNFTRCMEEFNVPYNMQQLKELRKRL